MTYSLTLNLQWLTNWNECLEDFQDDTIGQFVGLNNIYFCYDHV